MRVDALPDWLSSIGFKSAVGSYLREGLSHRRAWRAAHAWVRRMEKARRRIALRDLDQLSPASDAKQRTAKGFHR
jgi:hypothetical protein